MIGLRFPQYDGVVESCVSAATIVEIRKAKSQLAALHGQRIGWEEAERVFTTLDFISFEDSYLPQVGTELLLLLEKLLAYSHEAGVCLEVIRRVKEVVDGFHSGWGEDEVQLVCRMTQGLANQQQRPSNKVFQSAVALVKDLSQLMGQRDKHLSNIPKTTIRSLLASRRGRGKKAAQEDVDFDEPASKYVATGGNEVIESYLSKMEELAQLTEETDGKQPSVSDVMDRCLSIEEEVKKLGFEPNVL